MNNWTENIFSHPSKWGITHKNNSLLSFPGEIRDNGRQKQPQGTGESIEGDHDKKQIPRVRDK